MKVCAGPSTGTATPPKHPSTSAGPTGRGAAQFFGVLFSIIFHDAQGACSFLAAQEMFLLLLLSDPDGAFRVYLVPSTHGAGACGRAWLGVAAGRCQKVYHSILVLEVDRKPERIGVRRRGTNV